ncbi:uncharacterized protein LOC132087931 [Daphnia carinata]|uniref:uncharacterized protein LOC132087931 n=1 Tax=Daphnia carinata TaxID=120202 RepID=UPI002868835C|nr:uncharacterized protein LOC132087931 [Daphnia carinata]
MMCKIVYALLLATTIDARFLGSHENYQLQTVAIPLGWVLQDQLGQVDFAYPILAGTAPVFVDGVGNSFGPWASGSDDIVRTSYVTNFRGTNALPDDLPVTPIANFVAAVASEVDAVKASLTAGPVRMKRKNILRYRNGEFRPTLCTPTLCLSEKPYDEYESTMDTTFWD